MLKANMLANLFPVLMGFVAGIFLSNSVVDQARGHRNWPMVWFVFAAFAFLLGLITPPP